MIFYLTNSLILKEEKDLKNKSKYKHCLRNIANAAIEGIHILRGEYEILCDCINLFKGDDEFEMFFRDLVNNYATKTIPPQITYYIEVVKENPTERNENGCIIAQKDINDFYMSSSLMSCNLICEDENDCDFYEFITKWYIKTQRLNYNIKINKIGGGGGRILSKVRKHLYEGQVCICIVDSDRKFPEMSINKCSEKCKKLDNKSCGYRCILLNVNEIENLLPLNYIDDVFITDNKYKWENNQLQKKHFDYLSSCNVKIEILKYFDYKNGIKKDSLLLSNKYYKKFAKQCCDQNPDIYNNCTFEEYLQTIPDKGCVYKKLSETISIDVLNYINKNIANNVLKAPELLIFQEEEWIKIAKEILNWSCARIPEGLS